MNKRDMNEPLRAGRATGRHTEQGGTGSPPVARSPTEGGCLLDAVADAAGVVPGGPDASSARDVAKYGRNSRSALTLVWMESTVWFLTR